MSYAVPGIAMGGGPGNEDGRGVSDAARNGPTLF